MNNNYKSVLQMRHVLDILDMCQFEISILLITYLVAPLLE